MILPDDDGAETGSGESVDEKMSEVKEEEEKDEVSTAATTMNKDGVWVKPMEGLHDVGPPPFLKKTYEMVEDPETDPVVSWSETRKSFIVWDSHQLSKFLLPKYFKHSNFSSFIRQLNTYGFRKIDSDKWEFANEGFQGGKKHLLKNIKRKNKYNNNHKKQQRHLGLSINNTTLEDLTKPLLVETEPLQTLRTDNNILRVEMSKLREQQQDSHNQLTLVEERVRRAESKHQQMFYFLAKMSKNPAFCRQLLQKRMLRMKMELNNGDHEFGKKMKILGIQAHQNLGLDISEDVNFQNQVQEELLSLHSELTEIFPEVIEPGPIGPIETPFQASNRPESMVVDEGMSSNDSNFFLKLDDLLNKPQDCPSGYVQKQGFYGFVGSIP
ncbi:heat stress transcription factor A-7a isoform X1 [Cucumis sativus]|uniref:HSF-type DNA-binding domain-containing protein n=1 Tax=Cucumis sativus TaxID=3659 RepID=A0A0A0LEU6_CUCSA|nr:heat stress transcription factor A-7a isoform X1 [Cucumis sativus]